MNYMYIKDPSFCSMKKVKSTGLEIRQGWVQILSSLVTLDQFFNPSETQISIINEGINNYLKRS